MHHPQLRRFRHFFAMLTLWKKACLTKRETAIADGEHDCGSTVGVPTLSPSSEDTRCDDTTLTLRLHSLRQLLLQISDYLATCSVDELSSANQSKNWMFTLSYRVTSDGPHYQRRLFYACTHACIFSVCMSLSLNIHVCLSMSSYFYVSPSLTHVMTIGGCSVFVTAHCIQVVYPTSKQ